ncbi:SMI1/KNR4 family protein [Paenibacillus radicis (ex Xue et al. 2023)]|uniref:SMI1/KNR4 family protein n=1 Tax=Paenibacillus radicis (ex Xue et al. 2023) TaxID=2972489 RepID=A0ABT1YK13_9BACL|nr:SMI1/KNR4 family protein [Paenibacillus radicis (ex Xue et al. 2023)]MCR8633529.1 SMI1/KNR4 family protein [Paenibacillus radicis (ex Xue et al. 2023)]
MKSLGNIDLTDFWTESEYYTNSTPVNREMIENAERKLGYKLPKIYLELIRSKNGGTPKNTCYPTNKQTSWASDHIEITSINGLGGGLGIDSDDLGSQFMIEEWGYPDIGIVICSCPSAGHDAVMLDYSMAGKDGEPRVVHVDVEVLGDPEITFLAENFEVFIRGLDSAEQFEITGEELKDNKVVSVWICPEFEKLIKKSEG